MNLKVYKIEVLVFDFDDLGEAGVKETLENTKYPNWCITPHVKSIQAREVEWDDTHPLNRSDTAEQAYRELFK